MTEYYSRVKGVPGTLVDLLYIADHEMFRDFDDLKHLRDMKYPDDYGRIAYFGRLLQDRIMEKEADHKPIFAYDPEEAKKLLKALRGELEVNAWFNAAFERGELRKYFLLNNVRIGKRTTCQLDHILLGTAGVYHIETKFWRYKDKEACRTPQHLEYVADSYARLVRAKDRLKRALLKKFRVLPPKTVQSVICAPHDVFPDPPRGVKVIAPLENITKIAENEIPKLAEWLSLKITKYLCSFMRYYEHRTFPRYYRSSFFK